MFDSAKSEERSWIYRAGGVALSVAVGLLSICLYRLSGLLALIGISVGIYVLLTRKAKPGHVH